MKAGKWLSAQSFSTSSSMPAAADCALELLLAAAAAQPPRGIPGIESSSESPPRRTDRDLGDGMSP